MPMYLHKLLFFPFSREPPSPHLTLSSTAVEFGRLVMANQIASASFTITNSGTAASLFQLSSSPSQLPSALSVSPLEGKIAPNSSQDIKVSTQLRMKHVYIHVLYRSSTSCDTCTVISCRSIFCVERLEVLNRSCCE